MYHCAWFVESILSICSCGRTQPKSVGGPPSIKTGYGGKTASDLQTKLNEKAYNDFDIPESFFLTSIGNMSDFLSNNFAFFSLMKKSFEEFAEKVVADNTQSLIDLSILLQ